MAFYVNLIFLLLLTKTTKPTNQTATRPIQSRSGAQPIEFPADYPFVVPFIYKYKFPAATICSGTIVTDKLVLTAAYPIAIMPRKLHCVLPGIPHLVNASETQIEENCIDIKSIYFPRNWTANSIKYNLAVVELHTAIEFTLETSTGRIPFPDDLDQFDYNTICNVPSWKYRDAIREPGFYLEKIATELIGLNVEVDSAPRELQSVWALKFTHTVDFCPALVGMPVICDCNVVGVIVLDCLDDYMNCSTDCQYVLMISTLRRDIQEFLNDIVPNTFEDVFNDRFNKEQKLL